jgi:hypothetical protein
MIEDLVIIILTQGPSAVSIRQEVKYSIQRADVVPFASWQERENLRKKN